MVRRFPINLCRPLKFACQTAALAPHILDPKALGPRFAMPDGKTAALAITGQRAAVANNAEVGRQCRGCIPLSFVDS
jgi:hypothetical protein